MSKNDRKEEVYKEEKKLKEQIDKIKVEDVIKNNEYEFSIDEVDYRIKQPSYKDKREAYKMRGAKYVDMLNEVDKDGKPTYFLEEDLKEVYKKRGIDIDKTVQKINELSKERTKHMMQIGKALNEKKNTEDIKVFEDEVEKLSEEIELLKIKNARLLEPCIEQQLFLYVYTYLVFLCSEKLNEKEEWVKVWNTFEEFENSDEKLVNRITYQATVIFKNEIDLGL